MWDQTTRMGCAKVEIDGAEFAVCKYDEDYEGENSEHVQCLKTGCPEQECGQEEAEPACELALSSDPTQCLVSSANLVWSDEFEGTELNRDNWHSDLGTGDNSVPGAVGQNYLNWNYLGFITDDDIVLSDGSIKLLNQKRTVESRPPNNPWMDFEYSSGWIQSMNKVDYQYGYLEIRAKFPAGNKVWPAFWTIASSRIWCPEFDIAEYFGSHEGMGEHLCHGAWPGQSWDSHFERGLDQEEWHTYGLNWSPGLAEFYIDR